MAMMRGVFRGSQVVWVSASGMTRAGDIPVKKTTGITGLAVVPNGTEVLRFLYEKIHKEYSVDFPEDYAYSSMIKKLMKKRLAVLAEENDWRKVEERIGDGQVEELIEAAEGELTLAAKMRASKPWEDISPDDFVELEVIMEKEPDQ
mmetsp:Transcript_29476/g.82323  ORF Transcript_29476/g.82323 Transcript_29476/m.82323 type:complete len:147 (+) Transcript_29476:73-513(+)